MDLFEEKKLYRKKMRQTLAEYKRRENLCTGEEEEAKQMLFSSSLYQQASTILAYAATPQEFSLDEFIQQAVKQGKKLFLPKSYPHSFSMEFFQLDDKLPLHQQFASGSYGIREPVSHFPSLAMDTLSCKTLILVPGLAFTKAGNRLGKGKGYYDRFLSQTLSRLPVRKRPLLMGVCHSFQVIENLPAGQNDVPMDYVLTPPKIITCNP